jgi:serine/threonine protein kinase
VEELGHGADGTVFLCVNESVMHSSAVKLFAPKVGEHRDDARARAEKEKLMLNRVQDQQNVAQILTPDVLMTQSGAWIEMTMFVSSSLFKSQMSLLMATSPPFNRRYSAGDMKLLFDRVWAREMLLTPQVEKHILKGVATGLAAVHKCGICHRDIKMENILIAGEPATDENKVLLADSVNAMISDFGHAVLIEELPAHAGEEVGTVQCRGSRICSGIVLWRD